MTSALTHALTMMIGLAGCTGAYAAGDSGAAASASVDATAPRGGNGLGEHGPFAVGRDEYANGFMIHFSMEWPIDAGSGPVIGMANAGELGYPIGLTNDLKETPPLVFRLNEGAMFRTATMLPAGGKWWYGPWVDFVRYYGHPVDLSVPDLIVQFKATFYQDESDPNATPAAYEEAPIYVSFRDVNGAFATMGAVYGPDLRTDPKKYPSWKTVQKYLDLIPGDMTQPGFDLTQVTRLEFHGTDWRGSGADWIAITMLFIMPGEPRGACCHYDQVCTYENRVDCEAGSGMFWGAGVPCDCYICQPPCWCPGDANCDNVIDWRDIDYLVAGQGDNQAAWEALFPGCPKCWFGNLDASMDGHIDWRDIDPFVALFNTNCYGKCK